MRKKSKAGLHIAKLILLLPLALYLAFIIPEKTGYWDRWTGLDLVEEVADRFDRSTGPDDAVPVRLGDKEFEPLIHVIKSYSVAKFADDKVPHVIVRLQAKVYDTQSLGDGKTAQWTSPATPIAIMFYDWPNARFPGGAIPPDQFTVIGTLGNLHEWISRSREDRHFLIVDLLLVGFVPLVIGLYEFYVETQYE